MSSLTVPIRYEQSKRHEASIKRSELTLPAALPVAAALNRLSKCSMGGSNNGRERWYS